MTRPLRCNTAERIFAGMRQALQLAGEELGHRVDDLLARTDLLIYGTTRATNAIVTGRVARTAFLTTEGFPDVLVLKGLRLHLYGDDRGRPRGDG